MSSAPRERDSAGGGGTSPTWNEAGEVGLNGFELVDVILPLLVRDLPGVVVAAGLPLDLVGECRRGHGPYCCAFLKPKIKGI